MPQPISCTGFNFDGSIFAYACSYDWSRVRQRLLLSSTESEVTTLSLSLSRLVVVQGTDNYNPATSKNYILLHATKPAEVQGRARS